MTLEINQKKKAAKMILVTGGAGFIGSNFIRHWLSEEKGTVINLDKLTYAGNLNNLASFKDDPNHVFVKGDITDRKIIHELLQKYRPRKIIHFAAETHVDRSISYPQDFIETNIVGTFNLLEEVRGYWNALKSVEKDDFRFLLVSTDEVYGSLNEGSKTTNYAPNNPYSATKAASDHLVRAYNKTYELPTIIAHSSNNFGPFQYPEKFIPLIIMNGANGNPLPIYGDGQHKRNWLFVEDNCHALSIALEKGGVGKTYEIAEEKVKTNREVAEMVCHVLDELIPNSPHTPHSSLIKHIDDRPGHDRCYSIDSKKTRRELGWEPQRDFYSNLKQTVEWYLQNSNRVNTALRGKNKNWFKSHYTNLEF